LSELLHTTKFPILVVAHDAYKTRWGVGWRETRTESQEEKENKMERGKKEEI